MALAHYQGYVENVSTGKALPNAVIRVYSYPGNVLQSTFADLASTPLATVLTDSNGAFEFYISDGAYDLEYVFNGDVLTRLVNIPIYNPANAVGFVQDGTGAVERTTQAKILEVEVSVDDFGAVGNGIANDSPAIVAAQAAVAAAGGGVVRYTSGKTYNIGTTIVPTPGVTHKGTGRSFTDLINLRPGAKLISSTTDLFADVNADILVGIEFENLAFESRIGGGHIFKFAGVSGGGVNSIVAKFNAKGCLFNQANAAKSIMHGYTQEGVFSIRFSACEFLYNGQNTVPAIDIRTRTINSFIIDGNSWFTAQAPVNGSGTYAVYMESLNAGATGTTVKIEDVLFEIAVGGAVHLKSISNSIIRNTGSFDLLEAGFLPNNPAFVIDKGSVAPASNNIEFDNVTSRVGSTTKPDLVINTSVAGQSAFTLNNCNLAWLDGISAAGGASVKINGGTINNFQNIAYTRSGASPALDLHFGTTDAAAKSHTISNGYTGNNPGHLTYSINGVRVGGISPGNNFHWGASASDPGFYVDGAGEMRTKQPLYPPDGAGAFQSGTSLIAGVGVPGAGLGSNGQFYFRSDGGGAGATHLYFKTGGAWIALA